MIWWYGALLVLVYAGVGFIVSQVDVSWRRLYHPWMIVGGLNLIYTLTPLSSPIIREEQQALLESFLFVQLAGFAGLACGTLLAYALLHKELARESVSRMPIEKVLALRVTVVVFLFLWLTVFQISEGGINRVIQEGYLFGTNPSGGEVIAYAMATYPMMALITIGYFALGNSWEVLLAAALFAILNVLGGHRNLMTMEVGGLLAAHSMRGKRPSYLLLAGGGIFGFAFLMFAGIYRGLGVQGLPVLIAILQRDGLRVFDPSSQELGTSYNVYRLFVQTRGVGFENWLPGESYVRAFLSIVPRQLWPDRPAAIASYFSDALAPPGQGLGFSFNLEAYISAGTAGVVLATFILGFILTALFIRHCSRTVTAFGFSLYGTLVFISFNLNRIDFQTVLKIGFLLIGAQYVFLRLFRKKGWFLAVDPTIKATSVPSIFS